MLAKILKIFLILGKPKGDEFNPVLFVRHNLNNYITIEEAKNAYTSHYEALSKMIKPDHLVLLDPIEYLCNEVCMTRDHRYKFYYKNSPHMRPWYANK